MILAGGSADVSGDESGDKYGNGILKPVIYISGTLRGLFKDEGWWKEKIFLRAEHNYMK